MKKENRGKGFLKIMCARPCALSVFDCVRQVDQSNDLVDLPINVSHASRLEEESLYAAQLARSTLGYVNASGQPLSAGEG